jgi:pimeloyl-ACP methyl ester carboxylesterase
MTNADAPTSVATSPFAFSRDAWDYWIDASQRSLLFLSAMQQRGQRYAEHAAKAAPHVLKFTCEPIMDGRKLPRPVNYVLVRITPPKGLEIDRGKRPFVIVDPRAGHGPGIGGFKPDSEIGVALRAGHPCYFIGFLPEPVPGQTIEDIAVAEGLFLQHVNALHAQAEGKPVVIGNCQAGWAVMMLAATRPDLFGPIIVAGSPLSYWAGVRGENPMRYTGGLLGGSWLAALTGDLGNGKFDGAWLVTNFENLNPANTYWTKHHNLYAKVDTEVPRFLEFEEWWGGHVMLNAEEMQFIVDNLFVGNKLASGELVTSTGTRIDLRNIRSPVLVFCSKADNITPPPQALGWILDLYDSVDDIRAHGQTIIYAVHESIGHLGIFVSASVAKKEHGEFTNNIDLIDVLPPGLYEAVMTPKGAVGSREDLIEGDYLVRFEARTLDDIRALGCNDEDDDRAFAAVARVSEINLGLYRTFLQPWVRLWANEGLASWMQQVHPTRLPYTIFTDANPFLQPFLSTASAAISERKPVTKGNVFWDLQELQSEWIEKSLNAYRDVRDHMMEAAFHSIYGTPLLQALVGLRGSEESTRRRAGRNVEHDALVAKRIAQLKSDIATGGPREAIARILLYVRIPEGAADERSFNLLRQLRAEAGTGMTLEAFKTMVREQFFMLLLDERRAIEAIASMLEKDSELASHLVDDLHLMFDAVGIRTDEGKARLAEIEEILKRAGYDVHLLSGRTGHRREIVRAKRLPKAS